MTKKHSQSNHSLCVVILHGSLQIIHNKAYITSTFSIWLEIKSE